VWGGGGLFGGGLCVSTRRFVCVCVPWIWFVCVCVGGRQGACVRRAEPVRACRGGPFIDCTPTPHTS
jgi:hypothetical protein